MTGAQGSGGLDEVPLMPQAPGLPAPVTFEQLAALPDECIDVATGAALIARDTYASLDVDGLILRFDELAAPLRSRGLSALAPEDQADALSSYVCEDLGFRGNEQDYYDPRNTLLPDVLDRKLGIPITLSLVYCEIARRCGILASGISFPGHFLVRIDARDGRGEPVIVDPFFGGRRLDRSGMQRLLDRDAPKQKLDMAEHFAPAGARPMLVRMLINIK